MEAKGQKGEPLPIKVGGHGGASQRGASLPFSLGGAGVPPGGTITTVIVFINVVVFITFLISF